MRLAFISALMVSLVMFAGCKKNQPQSNADPSITQTADNGPVDLPPEPAPSDIGPVPTDVPPSTDGTRSYTVQKGDGLMAIARTQLGNASRWREIAALNPEVQPPAYALKVGQVIKLPAK